MTTATGARPHPIFLAGTWVESDDPLIIESGYRVEVPQGALAWVHASANVSQVISQLLWITA